MAAHDRLAFGPDVVFSYGPLGFVAAPRLYYPVTGLVAMAVDLAVATGLAYTVVRLLNRVLGIVASVVLTALALMVLNPILLGGAPLLPYTCLLLVALWSFNRALAAERPLRWSEVIGPAMVATTVLVIKLDAGVACIAVAGYAVVACALRTGGAVTATKRAAVFAGTVVVGLPVLWVAIGQPLGALPDWLRLSWDIATGYDAAMSLEPRASSWEYLAAALVVATIGTGLWSSFRGRARGTVLGFLALVAFITFKQGFVRHDSHSVQFFAMFTLLPLVLLRRWEVRQVFLAAAVPAVCLLAVANVDVLDLMSPGRRIDGIADVSRLVVSSSERRDLIAANRADLRASYGLAPEVTDRVAGHTVDIEPWELTIAWAYPEFEWRQAPVFQAYSAYTTYLDHENAGFLAGRSRPDFVLREPGVALDERLPRFEPPETTLELMCRYRVVSEDARWQLFERGPDRCGREEPVAERSVRLGEPFRVPRPPGDVILVARFDEIGESTLDRLRSLVYKAREFSVVINGESAFRFLTGHQDAPHVLAVPECLGTALDGSAVPPIRKLEVVAASGDRDDAFGVEFLEIPYAC
jgi:hypothetical protein